MRPRTLAREAALKALYQIDLRAEVSLEELDQEIAREVPNEDARAFARDLVRGTRENLAQIDEELGSVALNWSLTRMAVIDRNVLRLGAYELLFQTEEVPAPVAINEAVAMAKKYSTKDSGGFVNGILDKIFQRRAKPAEPEAPQ